MEDTKRKEFVDEFVKSRSHCRNFSIDKIKDAFNELKNAEEFHDVKHDYHKQSDLGLVFIVHDADTADKLKSFRYNNTYMKEEGTVLIGMENIRYSISLTINSSEDVRILGRYLDNEYDGFDRTFVLCSPKNETIDVMTMVSGIASLLSGVGRRYIIMNNKVLYLKQDDINKAFKSFFCIDEANKHIDDTSTENMVSDNLVPSKSISTGFMELDKKLGYGGLQTGRLYVLGGITSLGKTTLALNIAYNIAKSHNDVLIFSLEMSKYELVSKIHARNMNKLNQNMKNGFSKTATEIMDFDSGDTQITSWTDEPKDLLSRAKEMYRQYAEHLMILECSDNFGVKNIRESLAKFYDLNRIPSVVIVDYLQILAHESGRTDKQSVDKNILELKRLSRDFNIAMVVISSFNRSGYASDVDFKSFKESGSIEYSCDVVIGLQLKLSKSEKEAIINPSSKENETLKNNVDKKFASNEKVVELCILKNRSYKSRGKVDFDYYAKYDNFVEFTENELTDELQDITFEKWKKGLIS
jgi:replicative DNA helicase